VTLPHGIWVCFQYYVCKKPGCFAHSDYKACIPAVVHLCVDCTDRKVDEILVVLCVVGIFSGIRGNSLL